MATQAELMSELMRLDDQYEEIAGHNAFLFCKDSTGEPAYVFTGHHIEPTLAGAVQHMRAMTQSLAALLSGSES